MKTTQLTILKAIETIHSKSKGSKLDAAVYPEIQTELAFVSEYFQTNEIQSIVLSSFISLSCLEEIELKELISYFGMSKLEFLPFIQHLEILQNKNILEKNSARNYIKNDYTLKPHLITFIVANKPIPMQLIALEEKEDTFHQFLGEIDLLSVQKDKQEIDYRYFINQFDNTLSKYKKFKLVDFALKNLERLDSFVFFDVIIDGIAAGENNFQSSLHTTVDDFTNRQRDSFNYISNFLEGTTKLNTLNLIEKNQSSFSNKHKIQLSERAVKMLFEMEGIKFGYSNNKNETLIFPENINKTRLYYNLAEQEQLNPILRSLSHKAFSLLQKRLSANKMQSGLTTLFYGGPGTGKTETVYQLAKRYNRPIFKVDISQTKSMWFGESQKLVKKIFTDYNELKKHEKICPILFFNEADAIIGKRKLAGSSSVADTENSIQNILLEELENFTGILFATTNLLNNIDSAFERRFLFKIKFNEPSVENASKIWRSKLPTISKAESIVLSEKFKFSGGEMENIVRKCIMEEAVLGKKASFAKILSFCENEKWRNERNCTKIGF